MPAAFSAKQPMLSREIADRLGLSRDQFYNRRHYLHSIEHMPRPMSGRGSVADYRSNGTPKWDRATMEAWFLRHHPAMPQRPAANDQSPPLLGEQDPRWNAALAAEYGAR